MAKKETPNRIAEIRRAKGLTQAQLAELLDIHWVTVSKLERGKIQLHTGWMLEIANALGVEPPDLISERPDTKEIAITGSIGEDGLYTDFKDDDNFREEFEVDIPLQPSGAEFGFWAVVEGDRCWPIFHDGDKLHFTPVVSEEIAHYAGRYAIVTLTNGREYAGYLLPTSQNPRVDIQVINGKTLRNLEMRDAAIMTEVRFMWPLDHMSFPREPDRSGGEDWMR